MSEHRLEVARLGPAPCRAHAEAVARSLSRARGRDDLVERQQRLRLDTRVIACRLRAVPAVLGASARLDRQQRRALHAVRIEILAMTVCAR
jgi:hypothetical protein